MKKIFLFVITILFVNIAVLAQSKDEAAVAAVVETLRKAMVDGDRAALEKIASDKLSYGHSGGHVEGKAEFVEKIAGGSSDFVSIDLLDQTISVSGTAAVVRHKLNASTNDKGKGPAEVHLAVLLVFQKEGKEWKLLARQAVKVTQ